MDFIMLLAISILIWWLARYWKDRNGVLWGVLTLALMIPLTPFYMMGNRVLFHAGAILIGIIVTGCLAALPATKVCPYCKRRIHADAVVCSHCKRSIVIEELKIS